MPKVTKTKAATVALPSKPELLDPGAKSRTVRGANWLVYSLAVIGILVMLNVLGARHNKRWDVTAGKWFSISQQTKEVLAGLKEPIHVIAFTDPESGLHRQVGDLLREYVNYSGGKLTWEYLDPALHPSRAQRYNVLDFNTLIVIRGERHEKVDPYDLQVGGFMTGSQPEFNGEGALTNAILRVLQARKSVAYFLTGHGEKDITNQLRAARNNMQAEGYEVKQLNFLTDQKVPDDADLVVIAGPQRDLQAEEKDKLQEALDRGVSFFFMIDPLPPGTDLTHFKALLEPYGVKVHDSVVVDPKRYYQNDITAVVPMYGSHRITGKLEDGQYFMLLPGARSFEVPKEPREKIAHFTLLESSYDGFGETDFSQAGKFDEGKDIQGPVVMGVAIAKETDIKKEGSDENKFQRLVVLGSSAFAQENLMNFVPGNNDFWLNALHWLTFKDEGLSIRPKVTFTPPLFLTGDASKKIFVSVVVVAPALVLAMGVAVWWLRRHL